MQNSIPLGKFEKSINVTREEAIAIIGGDPRILDRMVAASKQADLLGTGPDDPGRWVIIRVSGAPGKRMLLDRASVVRAARRLSSVDFPPQMGWEINDRLRQKAKQISRRKKK